MIVDEHILPKTTTKTQPGITIFCATRLHWRVDYNRAESPLDNKGSDILLYGLKNFIDNYNDKIEIHMIRFGADESHIDDLISKLGLDEYIHWHTEMNHADFLNLIASSNIILENFGMQSSIGMAGRDALAMGKPVIAYAQDKIFEQELGEPLPIYSAKNPDDIATQLDFIVNNPAKVQINSEYSKGYARKYFYSKKAAIRCVNTIKMLINNESNNVDNS